MGIENSITNTTSITDLLQYSDAFLKQNNFNKQEENVVRKIFLHQRMSPSILKTLKGLSTSHQKSAFIRSVDDASLELLDSFYEHIYLKNKVEQAGSNKEQFGFCGERNIKNEWELISEKEVEIVNLINDFDEESYERLKQLGLQLITKKQVAFLLLAGGKNLRFGSNSIKQSSPFNIPSKNALIQIIFKRLQALGILLNCQINLFILYAECQKKDLFQSLQQSLQISHLKTTYIQQLQYGCLDEQGQLVIDDDGKVFMHPNGTGDIWAACQSTENFLQSFKYVQIFGLSNGLEHCFDCFMIGKLARNKMPWITLAAEDLMTRNGEATIYINKKEEIEVSEEVDLFYPNKCCHIFTNNSVFEVDYISKVIRSEKWEAYKNYRCKVHQFPSLKKRNFGIECPNSFQLNNKLANYEKILVFQKCYTQMFKMCKVLKIKKGCVVIVEKDSHFSNFIYRNDIKKCSKARSCLHKRWLGIKCERQSMIKQNQQTKMCEIDPYLSLEGQNLEQIKEHIEKEEIQYPLYLVSEVEQRKEEKSSQKGGQEGIGVEEDFSVLSIRI